MNRPADAMGVLSVGGPAAQAGQEVWEYWLDAIERSILFAETLDRRSEQYKDHAAKVAPHVLQFACELLMDGRELARPVNYVLVRVQPPDGAVMDERKRPFVIIDPRAGHGPGIGASSRKARSGSPLRRGIRAT